VAIASNNFALTGYVGQLMNEPHLPEIGEAVDGCHLYGIFGWPIDEEGLSEHKLSRHGLLRESIRGTGTILSCSNVLAEFLLMEKRCANVKTRLHRARHALRQRIQPFFCETREGKSN